MSWDPEFIWIEPGLLEKVLVITALPAFVLNVGILGLSERFPISQVPIFFTSAPVSITAWFYFVGWLIDRWCFRRLVRSQTA